MIDAPASSEINDNEEKVTVAKEECNDCRPWSEAEVRIYLNRSSSFLLGYYTFTEYRDFWKRTVELNFEYSEKEYQRDFFSMGIPLKKIRLIEQKGKVACS